MTSTAKLFISVAAVLFACSVQAQNKGTILKTEQMPQSAEYLPGPPEQGSGRFHYDSCQYEAGKRMRETERGRLAVEDASLKLEYFMKRFAAPLQRDFTPENYPATAKFIKKSYTTGRASIQLAKETYARPRPYQHFDEHTPIPEEESLEKNESYPSGHTIRAWMIALCLVSIDHIHQEDILRTGYELGQSRTIVGYHFQSDVDDARIAASAGFARLCGDRDWQELREKALAEFRSVDEYRIINDGDALMKVYSNSIPEENRLLREKSIDFTTEELKGEGFGKLAARMIATVTHPSQNGVGIAAPQVGILRRVVAVQRFDKSGEPFKIYPNIRIIAMRGEKQCGPEGCLSVPDMRGEVKRSRDIDIQYTDPATGKITTETVQGFTAVIFQHECDHLDGILYIDRLKDGENK